MKGNERILKALNDRLAEELMAINQYMFHSEMCENWGYLRLHEGIRAQAMAKMNHAEWLIERILFLEGIPSVSRLDAMKMGKSVQEMIDKDRDDELDAIRKYNESIRLAVECGDNETRELLEKIMKMEKKHIDWGEIQCDRIAQMGLANDLTTQSE